MPGSAHFTISLCQPHKAASPGPVAGRFTQRLVQSFRWKDNYFYHLKEAILGISVLFV